jgi:hypothetical protein
MKYVLVILLVLLILPTRAGAEALGGERTSAGQNAYIASDSVVISNPLPADIVTAGMRVSINVPVSGDVLAAAGSVNVANGALGNVRALGGRVQVHGPVEGDVAAAAGTLGVYGSARTIYGAAGSIDVEASSTGNVSLYGSNVTLGGDYSGDVLVTASNRLTILPGTHIAGALRYSAPEQLVLPESVRIDQGVRYTGSYAYVPTTEQVHQYAIAGAGIFFLVRSIAACILAGLLAGLFPRAAEAVGNLVLVREPKRWLRLTALGFAAAIGTPILLFLLFVSLVGAALSILLSILYALLLVLAYTSTGIVIGMLLRRTLLPRLYGDAAFSWPDALLGTFLVQLIGFIPMVGTIIITLCAFLCAGALLTASFIAAFPQLPRPLSRDTLRAYVDHT